MKISAKGPHHQNAETAPPQPHIQSSQESEHLGQAVLRADNAELRHQLNSSVGTPLSKGVTGAARNAIERVSTLLHLPRAASHLGNALENRLPHFSGVSGEQEIDKPKMLAAPPLSDATSPRANFAAEQRLPQPMLQDLADFLDVESASYLRAVNKALACAIPSVYQRLDKCSPATLLQLIKGERLGNLEKEAKWVFLMGERLKELINKRELESTAEKSIIYNSATLLLTRHKELVLRMIKQGRPDFFYGHLDKKNQLKIGDEAAANAFASLNLDLSHFKMQLRFIEKFIERWDKGARPG